MAFSCQLQCPYDYTDIAEIVVTEINPSTLLLTVSKPILSAGYLHDMNPVCARLSLLNPQEKNLKSTDF